MDLILVALIAGLAFWVGSAMGYGWGVTAGLEEGRVRRRLDELGKPWERMGGPGGKFPGPPAPPTVGEPGYGSSSSGSPDPF